MIDRIEMADRIGFVEVVDQMGDDLAIVKAARVSYGKHGETRTEEQDRRLLAYLFKHKHSSPYEMAKIKFNIKLPIFVMRQFVRHRMQNLNEVSGRYKEISDETFRPELSRRQDDKNKQASGEAFTEQETAWHRGLMQQAYDTAFAVYKELLQFGVSRELARIVLPLATYTEIVSCFDMNNLLKFFVLRIHPGAQKEIEDYAVAMLRLTRERFPWCIDLLLESNEYIRGKMI